MKPIFSLSKQNNFTVWEAGHWNRKAQTGFSVLVAGPNCERLKIIYDRDPTTTAKPALFFADVGNILVGSNIRLSAEKTWQLTAEVLKIESLQTEFVQGSPVPRATTSIIDVSRVVVPDPTDLDSVLSTLNYPEPMLKYQEIVRASILKSTCPQSEQRIFWGVPRTRNDE